MKLIYIYPKTHDRFVVEIKQSDSHPVLLDIDDFLNNVLVKYSFNTVINPLEFVKQIHELATGIEKSLLTTPMEKWKITIAEGRERKVIVLQIQSNKHLHRVVVAEEGIYYNVNGKVIKLIPIPSTLLLIILEYLKLILTWIKAINVACRLFIDYSKYSTYYCVVGRYKITFINHRLSQT